MRLRTTAAKRFKKGENAAAVSWKLLQVAESAFRRLQGAECLPAVYAGRTDSMESSSQPSPHRKGPPNPISTPIDMTSSLLSELLFRYRVWLSRFSWKKGFTFLRSRDTGA